MNVFLVSCPTCGNLELTKEDIRLVVYEKATWMSHYCFVCITCTDEISRPAPEEIISRLVRGGVKVNLVKKPAELQERHDGPALTWDDLLDFHRQIGLADILSSVAALEGSV